jgi:hypothetical protein
LPSLQPLSSFGLMVDDKKTQYLKKDCY